MDVDAPRDVIAEALAAGDYDTDNLDEVVGCVLAALRDAGIVLCREQVWVRCDQLPGPESCTFIETEDSTGAGVGSNVGLGWTTDEMGALLGPFFVPEVAP
jgi:hypothetical protein